MQTYFTCNLLKKGTKKKTPLNPNAILSKFTDLIHQWKVVADLRIFIATNCTPHLLVSLHQ